MKKFKEFLREDDETTYAGFKVRKPSRDEMNFLSKRTDVAGFYGTGDLGSSEQEGTMVINPKNQYMANPNAREGLKRNEATRGIYALEPDRARLAPDLTPEQDKELNFYTKDIPGTEEEKKSIRKQTFYGRVMGGESQADTLTPEQAEHASELDKVLSDKGYYGKIKAQRYETKNPMDYMA